VLDRFGPFRPQFADRTQTELRSANGRAATRFNCLRKTVSSAFEAMNAYLLRRADALRRGPKHEESECGRLLIKAKVNPKQHPPLSLHDVKPLRIHPTRKSPGGRTSADGFTSRPSVAKFRGSCAANLGRTLHGKRTQAGRISTGVGTNMTVLKVESELRKLPHLKNDELERLLCRVAREDDRRSSCT